MDSEPLIYFGGSGLHILLDMYCVYRHTFSEANVTAYEAVLVEKRLKKVCVVCVKGVVERPSDIATTSLSHPLKESQRLRVCKD